MTQETSARSLCMDLNAYSRYWSNMKLYVYLWKMSIAKTWREIIYYILITSNDQNVIIVNNQYLSKCLVIYNIYITYLRHRIE